MSEKNKRHLSIVINNFLALWKLVGNQGHQAAEENA